MERVETPSSLAEYWRQAFLQPGVWSDWGAGPREFVASKVLDLIQEAESRRVALDVLRHRSRAGGLLSGERPAPPHDLGLLDARYMAPWTEEAFRDQLAALGKGNAPVDLRNLSCRQALVGYEWARRPEGRRAILRLMVGGGRLRPARHFCYETSRDDERYSERLGFSFPALVRHCARGRGREVLLELGQGSGACMDGRRPYAREYLQVGCCDALRYTVRDFLLAALDRDALARGVAARLGQPDWQAAPAFWRQLCTFLAKILVLRPGVAPGPEVPFDEEVLTSLEADPGALVEIVREKSPLLALADAVPASEGAPHPERPGDFLYSDWEQRPGDAAFRAACELLARDGPGHLRIGPGRADALDVLPVYPCGAVLGDFRDLAARLRPAQVRLAVGVRSTQALEGQEYVDFMAAMARLLTSGDADEDHGIYVDDNARKNYGAHYPLEELREAERAAGFPFHVVRGRGPEPWEEDVPVAVVVTRSREKLRFVAAALRPGFRLQRPGDLLDDRELNSRLDRRPGGGRAPPT